MKTKVINHEFGQIFIFGDTSMPIFYVGIAKIMKDSGIASISIIEEDEVLALLKDPNNNFWNIGEENNLDYDINSRTFKVKDFHQEFLGYKHIKDDLKFKFIVANLLCHSLYNDPIPNYITLEDDFSKSKINSNIFEILSFVHNDFSFKSNASNNFFNVSLFLDKKDIKNTFGFDFTIMGDQFNATALLVPYKGYIITNPTDSKKIELSINESWDIFLFFQIMAVITNRLKLTLDLPFDQIDEVSYYICRDIFRVEESEL